MKAELKRLAPRIGAPARSPSRLRASFSYRDWGRRWVQLSSAQSGSSPTPTDAATQDVSIDLSAPKPDAKFEVLGAPYSLLSASLAASQPLYTRRGTLVGLSGKPENVVSSLSILAPVRRALLGIPFFYQKIVSASPVTALIASRSPLTSFVVAHMDGTVDWMVAQRQALLAWTGQTLSIRPTLNTNLAHWGNSWVTGRGLLALVGKGQVYQISLKAEEQFVVHPSHVVAYTVTQNPPLPYRFKSSAVRFQVPQFTWLNQYLSGINFFRVMRESESWKGFTRFLFHVRTWARRTIWGDSLFMQFQGPTQILLQTRGTRLRDLLTARDVNELADVEPGVLQPAAVLNIDGRKQRAAASGAPTKRPQSQSTRMSYASVRPGGKVQFEQS